MRDPVKAEAKEGADQDKVGDHFIIGSGKAKWKSQGSNRNSWLNVVAICRARHRHAPD